MHLSKALPEPGVTKQVRLGFCTNLFFKWLNDF